MTTVTVTSTHHWNINISLVLKVENDQIVKKTWEGLKEPNLSILDDIYQTFAFFGAGMDGLKCEGHGVEKIYDIKKIRDMIYKSHLAVPLKAVHLSTCGCNMGHCDMVRDYEISDPCLTYEDTFKLWSQLDEDGFYEYPDSVFLYLSDVKEIPKRWPKGHDTKGLPAQTLDDDSIRYFSWHYSR